jgi:hypothetical protein
MPEVVEAVKAAIPMQATGHQVLCSSMYWTR